MTIHNMPRFPREWIVSSVHVIRGQLVMVDGDLAALYGVKTKRLNEQVRRNIVRFPEDFAFRVTPEEFASLKRQTAWAFSGRGGRRHAPLVFTEHGALMAAAVLNSPVAIAASIEVVRAFVCLRNLHAAGIELAEKFKGLTPSTPAILSSWSWRSTNLLAEGGVF